MQRIINFSKQNQDVLPHLDKQPNKSAYVISLIRKDINKEQLKNKQILTKEQVIEIVKEVLKSHNFELTDTEKTIENFPINSVMNILSLD